MKPGKKNIVLTVLILISGIVLVIGGSKLFGAYVLPALPFDMPEWLGNVLRQMVVPYGLLLPLAALLYRLLPSEMPDEKKRIGFGGLTKCFVVQTGVSVTFMIAVNMATIILTGKAPQSNAGDTTSPYMLFMLLVFNPIFEELLFRKLTIDRLRAHGRLAAVVISAVMFSLPHIISQGLPAAAMTLVCGLVWGMVYYETGRLLPCCILHALINLMLGILSSVLMSHNLMIVYVLVYVLGFQIAAWIVLISHIVKATPHNSRLKP